MPEPQTPTGKRLWHDTDEGYYDPRPTRGDILAIEREAVEPWQKAANTYRDRYKTERALADQLAEALREVLQMQHGEMLRDPVGTLKRVNAALAAYEEARK